MTKLVLYFHGLGSSGKSEKTDRLRSSLEETGVKLYTPDLPTDPREVVKMVKEIVLQSYATLDIEKLVFCGTSLGGFYSIFFGEIFDVPYVVANPAITVSEKFSTFIKDPPRSFVTGELMKFEEPMIDSYKHMEDVIKSPSMNLANVFVAVDDDVIPYQPTVHKFKNASKLVVTPSGGHRYDSNWNLVIDRVKQLVS